MTEKPIAIVLGGTSPHIALLENLKKRGYYTILIDYLENPPAKLFADEHIKESTLEKDKVLFIASKNKASLVISTCVDQANATACYVAEKLNLSRPYSYETAVNVTNKNLMKEIMCKNNIPTSKYISIKNLDEFYKSDINLPVVIKPVDSNSSAGVRKASTDIEFHDYFKQAIDISRTKCVIIEEYVNGMEISIDCFVQNGKTHIILIRQKLELIREPDHVLQSSGSFSPGDISDSTFDKIQKIANKIPATFGIDNTPLLIQAFIENDNINIIELMPRIGGGLSYRTIQLSTGFDILNASIDSFLDKTPVISYNNPICFFATIIIYAFPCIFQRVEGVETLLADKIIEEFYYYKTSGTQIGSDMSTSSRIGAFIVKADNKEILNEKIKKAIKEFQVYDINNNPVMCKDVFNRKIL
jgi:carbamoylphosphate synthase large subunit